MGVNYLAYLGSLVWGFAEASLFFIVPDVLLSWLALRERRVALIACGFAVIGALIGGAVMYFWGAQDLSGVRDVLVQLPAVDVALLDRAQQQIHHMGVLALLQGGFSGIPYKAYVVHAASAHIGWFGLLSFSVLARGIRFVVIVWLTRLVVRRVFPNASLTQQRRWLLLGWLMFYAFYFWRMASPG